MMEQVTGVILAGGQGRRMGGIDKGLQQLQGRPMAQWVLERLAPQVHSVLIIANRNLEAFLATGERKVGLWHASLKVAEADFDDQADAFSNINSADELLAIQNKGRRQ